MAGPIYPFSPLEVFRDIVRRHVSEELVPHVTIGPLSHEQQSAGGLSLMDAGAAKTDNTGLVIFPRLQIRCVGQSLAQVEQISGLYGGSAKPFAPYVNGSSGTC